MTKKTPFGITGADDKWAYFRVKPFDYSDKLLYDSRGPWPTPAPGRPLSEVAEVANLPDEEKKDWKKNVQPKYIIKLIKCMIPGLWWAYITSGSKYKKYDDKAFNDLFSRSMYSKFICKLDKGDQEIFSEAIEKTSLPIDQYRKLDFSGMEHICGLTYEDMHAAASMVLLSPDGSYSDDEEFKADSARYKAIAIYLYSYDKNGDKQFGVYHPNSTEKSQQRKWHLAKYFALQGAVHRINMTEHGRLHFPLDTVNAVTKSILPTDHPLFALLIPHLRLSLAVNNNVLESSGSLISRTNWTIWSPFVAEGKYVRKLIADGYVGRTDKENAFPPYEFPATPFNPDEKHTSFNLYRMAYYKIFQKFVKSTLETILVTQYSTTQSSDEKAQQDWEFIALWAECIREWVPGFIGRADLGMGNEYKESLDGEEKIVQPKMDVLVDTVTYILWNVTVSHASDHRGFANSGPQGNIFRLHVAPPFTHTEVPEDFENNLVKPWDLFQSYLTNTLFYSPMNLVTLEEVEYDFNKVDLTGDAEQKRTDLKRYVSEFMHELRACDKKQLDRDKTMCPLSDVSSSIQY